LVMELFIIFVMCYNRDNKWAVKFGLALKLEFRRTGARNRDLEADLEVRIRGQDRRRGQMLRPKTPQGPEL